MRNLDPAELAAIIAGTVAARELVSIRVKHRITGAISIIGFWSDGGSFTCQVVNGFTGAVEERSFNGGALRSVGDITLTSDISIRPVDVVLSAIDGSVETALRDYDARNAPIEIHRGFFDPTTMLLVAPAKARFIGFIDTAPIETAAEGDASTVTLSCVSHTRELTRKNPDVRSHESQILRRAGDDFYRDTGVVGDWSIPWGKKQVKGGK